MATYAYWIGNAQTVAQVDTTTLTAVANGAVLSAKISNKTLTYTCTASDTTSTAAANFAAVLSASGAPGEFKDATFAASNNVITATAAIAGMPFTLTMSAAGGATLTQVHTVPNGSPSDVVNANNWLRNGQNVLPQPGDVPVIAGANAAPLLWNLDQLPGGLAGLQRWQSFGQQIGLPDWNSNGNYLEYRPAYLKLGNAGSSSGSPSSSSLSLVLGMGLIGNGPSLERYDTGSTKTQLTVLASGTGSQDYTVYFLGQNPANTIFLQGTSLGVANGPGETSQVQNVQVDGSGTLTLGQGTTVNGTVTVYGAGVAALYTAPPVLNVQNGATVTIGQDALTWPSINVQGGSLLTWLCGGTVTDLNLLLSSQMDKSQDLRPLTINLATVDGDTCTVNDPNSVITWPTGTLVNGQVGSGWLLTGPGRNWKTQ